MSKMDVVKVRSKPAINKFYSNEPILPDKEVEYYFDSLDPASTRTSMRFGGQIPERATLTWKSINVSATTTYKCKLPLPTKQTEVSKKLILKDANGIVKVGQMVALMGSSGSGKTTLLNALNYRTNSNLKVEGDIMLNGSIMDPKKMSLISCYVQQDDLFFGTLTVLEHLEFHAMLRMDARIPIEQKKKRVDEVLKQFGLEVCKDVKIGIPGRIKGISGGQMRRLSFASEILTDPPLIFCDEPTSGLDSFMAKSIVQCMKRMAYSGKTIICTIHQPSSETFSYFDHICLLANGRTAFFGRREDALTFFADNLKKICPSFSNPADFYMDVLGVDVYNEQISRAEIEGHCDTFMKSDYNTSLINKIDNVQKIEFKLTNTSGYKSSWFTQMGYLYKRCALNYFRNYRVVINDLLMAVLTALLAGIIYLKRGTFDKDGKCSFTPAKANNVTTALFFVAIITSIQSVLAAVMTFPAEIPVFYREHFTSVYRTSAYYLSKLLFEIPLYIIIPLVHALIVYFMVQFGCNAKNFLLFLTILILIAHCSYAIGHVVSILSSSPNLAISIAAGVLAIQMLFSGFFLRQVGSSSVFLSAIKYVSVSNYGYDALMINQWETNSTIKSDFDEKQMEAELVELDQLEDLEKICRFTAKYSTACIPNGYYLLKHLKIEQKEKVFDIIMLVVLTVVWRSLALSILAFKAKKKPWIPIIKSFFKLNK